MLATLILLSSRRVVAIHAPRPTPSSPPTAIGHYLGTCLGWALLYLGATLFCVRFRRPRARHRQLIAYLLSSTAVLLYAARRCWPETTEPAADAH